MKQKKKMTSTGFLLLITIVLFFVMYAAGMVIFADKGFAKPQMFLNLFVSNAGLLVISCGLTIVMITGGIDISVGSVTALVCMVMADLMENKGVSAYVAVLAALLIGLAFGIVQGFLVTYMGIQPFIVTLADVLRTWYDSNHQYRHDLHQKRSIPEMGKLPFLHAIWFYKQKR